MSRLGPVAIAKSGHAHNVIDNMNGEGEKISCDREVKCILSALKGDLTS